MSAHTTRIPDHSNQHIILECPCELSDVLAGLSLAAISTCRLVFSKKTNGSPSVGNSLPHCKNSSNLVSAVCGLFGSLQKLGSLLSITCGLFCTQQIANRRIFKYLPPLSPKLRLFPFSASPTPANFPSGNKSTPSGVLSSMKIR